MRTTLALIYLFLLGCSRTVCEAYNSCRQFLSVQALKRRHDYSIFGAKTIVNDVDDIDPVDFGNGLVTEDERISLMEQVRENSPDDWTVTKKLLGINGFTYVLTCFIVFFLVMNFTLGEGWLGQRLGLEGAGSYERISDSLPLSIDLNTGNFALF